MGIKYQAGTVDPSEYNWEEQFSFEGVIEPFIKMDVGKVRGLAIALERSEAEVVEVYEAGIKEGAERIAELGAKLADRDSQLVEYHEYINTRDKENARLKEQLDKYKHTPSAYKIMDENVAELEAELDVANKEVEENLRRAVKAEKRLRIQKGLTKQWYERTLTLLSWMKRTRRNVYDSFIKEYPYAVNWFKDKGKVSDE
jgi:chromosome segregation ATPase